MQRENKVVKILAILIILAVSQQYGQNMITNGNFSQDSFSGLNKYFPTQVHGWKCRDICEIDNCTLVIPYLLNFGILFADCTDEVINLNSNNTNELVTQSLNLRSGYYQLNFNYYYPQGNAALKYLNVSFNNQIILHVHPQSNNYPFPFYFSQTLQAVEGLNIIGFQNLGYFADTDGFKISNVSLVRILDQNIEQLVSGFFKFEFIEGMASFSGGRVFFGGLCSFLVNLDRFQFYSYHDRIYSYNQQLLLKNIDHLQSIKGQLFQELQDNLFSNFIQALTSFFNSLSYKGQYITYRCFQNPTKNTFSEYIGNFIVFQLPGILTIFLLLNILFRLLFNIRISKFVRQYSFYGIILPLCLQGKIQQLTFHIFAQLKTFFSISFKHKLFNICIAAVFFIVVATCFGAHFLFRYHYDNKAKYLTDSKNSSLSSLVNQNFDKGVMIFLYGATHQLMLSNPTPQLAILGLLEIMLIAKKIMMRQQYQSSILLFLSILNSFLRLYFQVTTYLYAILEAQRKTINQNYHKYLIILLIFKLGLQIGISLFFMMRKLFQFRKKSLIIIVNIDKANHQAEDKRRIRQYKKSIFNNIALKKRYQIVMVQRDCILQIN